MIITKVSLPPYKGLEAHISLKSNWSLMKTDIGYEDLWSDQHYPENIFFSSRISIFPNILINYTGLRCIYQFAQ